MTLSPTLKRALIITGFVIIVIGMFFVIYLVFFRGSTTGTNTNVSPNINGLPTPTNGNVAVTPNTNTTLPATNTNTSTTGPSQVANGGATNAATIVDHPVSTPIVTGTGNLQYYDRPSGKFYRLSPDGTTRTPMSDAVYKDVQTITWSPNGNQAILTFPDNAKILYNFDTKKQTTLPAELNNFVFSTSGTQVVSKYLDAANLDNQWLMVSNPDGTNSQSIEQMAENADKVTTTWSPNDLVVATYETSLDGEHSTELFIGKNNENLPSVTVEGRGFIPNWSPDASHLLFSTYSDYTDNAPHLYLMDGTVDGLGKNIIDLNLDTRADACVFSQDNHTIFCSVPYYSVSNSGAIPSLAFNVPDNIYAIDLLRGSASLLARPVDPTTHNQFTIGTLQLSADESSLVFTDVASGSLHRLQLH